MNTLLEEVRVVARGLARSPGFTFVAILTLGLGIGVTATMFSVIDGVLLRSLPFRDPDRLVAVTMTANGAPAFATFPEYFDLRDQAKSFAEIAVEKQVGGNLTGGDEPERVEVRGVSGSFFPMLGVRPLLGRTFGVDDEIPGISPIGVISYGLWQRRFGGERSVIGKRVRIEDDDYTIIGVMPRGFEHPAADPSRPVDFWFATGFRAEPWPEPNRFWRVASITARLAPGVTVAQAQDELNRFVAHWQASFANAYPRRGEWKVRARQLQDVTVGDVRRPLSVLFGAVAIVMLIACANVAGLQLARQTTRTGEFAVRQALGARRWRIARPLLIESLVLSLVGGALGTLLAVGGVAVFKAVAPATLPRTPMIAVDLRVLLASLAAAIVTGVIFGLAPAAQASKLDLASALRSAGRGMHGAGTRARSLLVVTQLALSLMLLSGATLLIRSLAAINAISPGFDTNDLLTMVLAVPYPNDVARAKYIEPSRRLTFYREVLRRVREVPGVADAAMAGTIPMTAEPLTGPLTPENATATTDADAPQAELVQVSEGYFRTMGIPLVSGRDFATTDNTTSTGVVILSETVARRLWPNADAVGQRVKFGSTRSQLPFVTVIGVVRDVKTRSLDVDSPGQFYASFAQFPTRPISIAIRTRANADLLAETLRRTVLAVDRDQPVYAVRTMQQLLASRTEQRRFAMTSLVTFAVIAIALAGVALYGLIAYTVAQRRREIGVRLALGGTTTEIAGLVVRDGIRLAAVGAGIGVVAVIAFGRVLASLLYGVSAHDPVTLAFTVVGTLLIAALACVVPSRRAAAVSPLEALAE